MGGNGKRKEREFLLKGEETVAPLTANSFVYFAKQNRICGLQMAGLQSGDFFAFLFFAVPVFGLWGIAERGEEGAELEPGFEWGGGRSALIASTGPPPPPPPPPAHAAAHRSLTALTHSLSPFGFLCFTFSPSLDGHYA